MTHGTFNARNYDAGISTPGLRGVAFDAGAFDAWKIDAGWFLTHRTTTQGDFWRTNLRGDFWRTNLGGDFWRTNFGGDFWRTNLRGWFLTHQFWGWFLTHFCMIFDAYLGRLIFQVHFRTALQLFEFRTFFLYIWSLKYLLFRFVFQHPFPVSEHHFTVSEQPFLF